MDVPEFFLKLLIILASAKLLAEVFARLTLPSVLGEVAAGIIIGPSLLDVIQPEPTFFLLAEIGILLLLFEVGMETDVTGLVKVGKEALLVAFTGVIVPGFLLFVLASGVLRLPLATSLFIGGTFVATSIGITVSVLNDLKLQHSRSAQIVLGAAVVDDIIGVVVLALLYDFAVKGSVDVYASLTALLFIAVFLVAAPVLTKLLVPFAARLEGMSRTGGMLPVIVVCLILALAVISHGIGAPAILGAFTAGLALACRFFLPLGRTVERYSQEMNVRIQRDMKPLTDLFVPVFFVVVGVSINFRIVDIFSRGFLVTAGLLTAAAIAAKTVSGVWARGGLWEKAMTGISMIPRGEVGLIFAQIGKTSGAFDEQMYATVVFVVALTTLGGPLMLRAIRR